MTITFSLSSVPSILIILVKWKLKSSKMYSKPLVFLLTRPNSTNFLSSLIRTKMVQSILKNSAFWWKDSLLEAKKKNRLSNNKFLCNSTTSFIYWNFRLFILIGKITLFRFFGSQGKKYVFSSVTLETIIKNIYQSVNAGL